MHVRRNSSKIYAMKNAYVFEDLDKVKKETLSKFDKQKDNYEKCQPQSKNNLFSLIMEREKNKEESKKSCFGEDTRSLDMDWRSNKNSDDKINDSYFATFSSGKAWFKKTSNLNSSIKRKCYANYDPNSVDGMSTQVSKSSEKFEKKSQSDEDEIIELGIQIELSDVFKQTPLPKSKTQNNASTSKNVTSIKSGVSLKDQIKKWNKKFIEDIEEEYSQSDAKKSEISVKLAKLYLNGKRCQKDVKKAKKILSASSNVEAKYLLLTLAFQEEQYADFYHYFEFFILKKWNCDLKNLKINKTTSLKRIKNGILTLEFWVPEWILHASERLAAKIVEKVGEKQAKEYKKIGKNVRYAPKII